MLYGHISHYPYLDLLRPDAIPQKKAYRTNFSAFQNNLHQVTSENIGNHAANQVQYQCPYITDIIPV